MRKVRQIPEDRSPESIKDVVSILVLIKEEGFGLTRTECYLLDGTVEEKLQQYKDATGTEWNGLAAQTITEPDDTKPISLNLGQQKPDTSVCKHTQEAQEKIDALVVEARALLALNDKEKQKRATKNIPAEASLTYIQE